MNSMEQRTAAKKFADNWKGRGDEKSDTQSFWIALLEDIFGVRDTYSYIKFEDRVQLGHKSFIDARIPKTRVLIEQKTIGKDLNKKSASRTGLNSLLSSRQKDTTTSFLSRKKPAG